MGAEIKSQFIPSQFIPSKIAVSHSWGLVKYEWKPESLAIQIDKEDVRELTFKDISDFFGWRRIISVDPDKCVEFEPRSEEELEAYYAEIDRKAKQAAKLAKERAEAERSKSKQEKN